MDTIPQAKPCRKCGTVKPLADFSAEPRNRDGHSGTCRECSAAYKLAWQRQKRAQTAKPRQLVLPGFLRCGRCRRVLPEEAFTRASDQKTGRRWACAECVRAHKRAKYASNLEASRAYGREQARRQRQGAHRKAYEQAYLAANRERRNAVARDWRHRNADKHKAIQDRHRMRRLNAPVVTFTDADWLTLLDLYGNRCAYCLNVFAPTALEREHIVPVSKGGTHEIDNVVPACRSCNARKHDSSLLQFLLRTRLEL